jgi:hypothetical protein
MQSAKGKAEIAATAANLSVSSVPRRDFTQRSQRGSVLSVCNLERHRGHRETHGGETLRCCHPERRERTQNDSPDGFPRSLSIHVGFSTCAFCTLPFAMLFYD